MLSYIGLAQYIKRDINSYKLHYIIINITFSVLKNPKRLNIITRGHSNLHNFRFSSKTSIYVITVILQIESNVHDLSITTIYITNLHMLFFFRNEIIKIINK